MRVSIVGAGRTGRTLGRLIHRAGLEIVAVTCRSPERAREAARFIGAGRPAAGVEGVGEREDIVLLCVPDAAVAGVAATLSVRTGTVVAHTSGALGLDELRPAASRGAEPGSIHPLRSFADPERAAASFAGTACAVEGTPRAAEALADLATRIGGVPLRVAPGGKTLYHAAAVFASNYLVALFEAARRLLREAGVPEREGLEALARLAEGTLANVRADGPAAALTGPVERGDEATVARHLEAIRTRAPELGPAYAALGRIAAEIADARGRGDAAARERIRAALEAALERAP